MITEKDRRRAKWCLECPVCRYARKKQKGLLFWFLKRFKGRFCPYCRAYKKVYNQNPHEPIPD